MEGLKLLKQKVEQKYLDDLDKAAENRIRCLDVINTVREMSNELRRTEKATNKLTGNVAGESE